MRAARISSLNFHGGGNIKEGLGQADRLIKKTLLERPDLMVLPECFANSIGTAETVPGPIIDHMAKYAKEGNCYIIAPLYQKSGDKIFNSSVLLGRDGEVVGVYHKTFPTDTEIKDGVTPGDAPVAFQTDFGRIGMAICFDLNFREVADGLVSDGAEIVFFSSMYEGGRQICQWALDYGVYMVSSHWGGRGYFVDKTGYILEKSELPVHPVITRTINFDRHIFHHDYTWKYFDEIRQKYGDKIHIEAIGPEGRCAIESLSNEVDVLALKEEFGLELNREYMARSRKIRQQALADRSKIGQYLRQDKPW